MNSDSVLLRAVEKPWSLITSSGIERNCGSPEVWVHFYFTSYLPMVSKCAFLFSYVDSTESNLPTTVHIQITFYVAVFYFSPFLHTHFIIYLCCIVDTFAYCHKSNLTIRVYTVYSPIPPPDDLVGWMSLHFIDENSGS